MTHVPHAATPHVTSAAASRGPLLDVATPTGVARAQRKSTLHMVAAVSLFTSVFVLAGVVGSGALLTTLERSLISLAVAGHLLTLVALMPRGRRTFRGERR
jgi:arginine exporter protein ArgO